MKQPLVIEGGSVKVKKDALEVLEDARKQVEAGKIVSVLIVIEEADGTITSSYQGTEDRFAQGGKLVRLGLHRLGLVTNDRPVE
ncbi:hypothetical protein LCGC14_1531120 [marine sediment metagenome]|uniref:Uncharacterized protein n=1 Tax=marine sediment metagenome TaxID=412755 RepID=A0A0F9JGP3_9ZZZZ